jgi:DNA-directed RNA polymerase subunit RPC12/RpoP
VNFLHKPSYTCDKCDAKFKDYDELVKHARELHHHPIVKCHVCGKEFVHEKDRLHHAREEHEKKVQQREIKNLYKHDGGSSSSGSKREKKENISPQEDVDIHTRKFSDNFE